MAVSSCYQKRDFSESGRLTTGCVVTIVFRISDILKVSNGDITEDDFIKLADFYIKDESDFKKIAIGL